MRLVWVIRRNMHLKLRLDFTVRSQKMTKQHTGRKGGQGHLDKKQKKTTTMVISRVFLVGSARPWCADICKTVVVRLKVGEFRVEISSWEMQDILDGVWNQYLHVQCYVEVRLRFRNRSREFAFYIWSYSSSAIMFFFVKFRKILNRIPDGCCLPCKISNTVLVLGWEVTLSQNSHRMKYTKWK